MMVPARTAPSQGIGLALMLFCKELRYVGGSSDMVVEWSFYEGLETRI